MNDSFDIRHKVSVIIAWICVFYKSGNACKFTQQEAPDADSIDVVPLLQILKDKCSLSIAGVLLQKCQH